LNELPSLDPELHQNLMYLKDPNTNVDELSLDFTIVDDILGQKILLRHMSS